MIKKIAKTSTFEKCFKKYQHTSKVIERLRDCAKEMLMGKLSPKWENHKLWGIYV
jgi:hypothetical protein